MGVAGNTTDLKLADTAGGAGRRPKTVGTLAAWKVARAGLEAQRESIGAQLAQIDAFGKANLGCGLVAQVDQDGSLRINAGGLTPPAATLALRDHLCNVLGLPDRFQGLTTLTEQEAADLARKLIDHRVGDHQKHRDSQVLNRALAETAIFDALDHVGVIQTNPSVSRSPGTPASQQGESVATQIAKPEASAAPAGTAGSAQYQVSFNSESLHRVIEILDNTVKLIERVHNRVAISQDEFAEIGKKLSGFTMNLGLETTRVTKPANPNAASEDWDALHGINVDGNIGKQVDVSA